jgi:hypothetical protein
MPDAAPRSAIVKDVREVASDTMDSIVRGSDTGMRGLSVCASRRRIETSVRGSRLVLIAMAMPRVGCGSAAAPTVEGQ